MGDERRDLGPRKDMGSPFRRCSRKSDHFPGVIDGFYQRFPSRGEGRPGLNGETIKRLADGRIYSGDQAKPPDWWMTSATWKMRSTW